LNEQRWVGELKIVSHGGGVVERQSVRRGLAIQVYVSTTSWNLSLF
jgi:hypothetical protein